MTLVKYLSVISIHLKLITGHVVTPPATGTGALAMGMRRIAENASLRRATRTMT
ncbi:hypothetical protein ACLOJK_025548 [Asimina triloba]